MTTDYHNDTLPLGTLVVPAFATEDSQSAAPEFAVPVTTASGSGVSTHAGDLYQAPSMASVWGTNFASLDMAATVQLADDIVCHRKPQYMVTANLNYLMLTEQHPRLSEVNAHAAAVLADGYPIVLRSRTRRAALPCRVAGSDLIVELAKLASLRGFRIFFLGGADQVAQRASMELKRRFPTLQVAGSYSPPFRRLSSAEHEQMLARIREADTDILLVAFGQPKGEFWIYDNLQALGVPLSIQLGASFDFLAGTARRAPKIWQRLGAEWLYRACSDPRRLVPRYSQNAWFLARLLGRDVARKFWGIVKRERNDVKRVEQFPGAES